MTMSSTLASLATLAAVLAPVAHAQIVATVTVSHDHPTGLVLPGETIRVKSVLTWNQPDYQLAGMKGGLLSSPNVGLASNRFSEFTNSALVNLGQFSGGSLTGVDIAVTPAFFTGGVVVPPSGNYFGIEVVSFDWKAPEAGFGGPVAFDWTPDPSALHVRFFVPGFPSFPTPETVYIGTAVNVIPAPAGLLALLPALALVGTPRRRPA